MHSKAFDLVVNNPPPLHPAAQVALVVGILAIVGAVTIIFARHLWK